LRLWKPALYKKKRSIDRNTYFALHDDPSISLTLAELYLFPGNIIWSLIFGWWMALIYIVVGTVGLWIPSVIGWIGCKLLFYCCGPSLSPPNGIFIYRFFNALAQCSKYSSVSTPLLPFIY